MEWIHAIILKITLISSGILVAIGLVPPQNLITSPVTAVETIQASEEAQEVKIDLPAAPLKEAALPPVVIVVHTPAPASTPEVPPSASSPAPVVESSQMPENTIDVYELSFEQPKNGFYYRGDKKVIGATINGVAATINESKEMENDSCIKIWKDNGEFDRKVCGGFVARFDGGAIGDTNEIVITAEGGATFNKSIAK